MTETLKIGIFGGTRGVGRCALEQALEKGHYVTVLARNPQALNAINNNRLNVVKGDVMDKYAVASVVAGQDVSSTSRNTKRRIDILSTPPFAEVVRYVMAFNDSSEMLDLQIDEAPEKL